MIAQKSQKDYRGKIEILALSENGKWNMENGKWKMENGKT